MVTMLRRPVLRAGRSGGALALVIVVMLILDCVVLGTIHLAMLERSLAGNATLVLRTRLAAEGAAATALAPWQRRLDSLAVGATATLPPATTADGISVSVTVDRLSATLLLVRAVATVTQPMTAQATASALFLPPVLPHGLETEHALENVLQAVERLRDRCGVAVIDSDTSLVGAGMGVIVALGSVHVADGAEFAGAVFAAGDVVISPLARVAGAVLARGSVIVPADWAPSAGVAETAVVDACLTRVAAASHRPRLPGF
jgi:hypothetical protein